MPWSVVFKYYNPLLADNSLFHNQKNISRSYCCFNVSPVSMNVTKVGIVLIWWIILVSKNSTPWCARKDFEKIQGFLTPCFEISYMNLKFEFCVSNQIKEYSVFINWMGSPPNFKRGSFLFLGIKCTATVLFFLEIVNPSRRVHFSNLFTVCCNFLWKVSITRVYNSEIIPHTTPRSTCFKILLILILNQVVNMIAPCRTPSSWWNTNGFDESITSKLQSFLQGVLTITGVT